MMLLSLSLSSLLVLQAIQPTQKRQIDPLIDSQLLELGSGDAKRMFLASEYLGKLGKRAIPALVSYVGGNAPRKSRLQAMHAFRLMGRDALPALPLFAKLLKGKDADFRGYAIEFIGRVGLPEALPYVPLVRAAWKDPSPTIRRVAIYVSQMIDKNDARLVADLMAAFSDTHPRVRESVALALGNMERQAAPALDLMLKGMNDKLSVVRHACAVAAGKIGVVDPPRLIAKLSEKESRQVRQNACLALGYLKPVVKGQVEALIEAAHVPFLREKAFSAMQMIGAPAIRPLGKVLDDEKESPEFLIATLESLGTFDQGVKIVADRIAKHLSHKDAAVRRQAAYSLAQIGKAATAQLDQLIAALDDTDRVVRRHALSALARIGKRADQVIPKIIRLVRSGDPELGYWLASALRVYRDDALPAIQSLLDSLESKDPKVRLWAATGLGGIGPGAIPALSKALQASESSTQTKVGVIKALGEMGEKGLSTMPLVLEALRGGVPELVQEAARTLTRFGRIPEEQLPTLLKAVDSRELRVRLAVILALGRCGRGNVKIASKLVSLAKGLDKAVSYAAIEALGDLKSPASVPSLIAMLKDEDEHVRWRAAQALGRIGPPAKAALPALREALKDYSLYVRPAVRDALKLIRG